MPFSGVNGCGLVLSGQHKICSNPYPYPHFTAPCPPVSLTNTPPSYPTLQCHCLLVLLAFKYPPSHFDQSKQPTPQFRVFFFFFLCVFVWISKCDRQKWRESRGRWGIENCRPFWDLEKEKKKQRIHSRDRRSIPQTPLPTSLKLEVNNAIWKKTLVR